MIITIDASGSATLEGARSFDGFHVAAPTGATAAEVAAALGPDATVVDDDHVFVPQDVVRSLAGDAVDDDWEHGFAAMVNFADSKGWLDPHGAIRAHIERR